MSCARLPDGRVPVVLTSHADDLLAEEARAILGYVETRRCEPAQVAAELAATRRVRRHRAVLRARDAAELADALRAVATGQPHPLVERSSRRSAGRTAFVFPGQGGQWPSMGAESYRRLPAYRDEADRLDAAFHVAGLPSPLRFLTTAAASDPVSQFELQGAQFVHSVALAAVWRAHRISPDLTIGHSLGEVAAAYVAGAITLADSIAVLAARARAIESIPGDHGVAVLGLEAGQAEQLLTEVDGWLELSAVNATASVAVSGERQAIENLVAAVQARGQFARALAMSFPAHTTAMESRREDLLRALPPSRFADSPVQFVGSASGSVVAPGTEFGSYWYANLRNTIRFDKAVRSALDMHADSFIEMSAHPSLLFAIEDGVERTGRDEPIVLVGSGHRDRPVVDTLSANIVTAAAADTGYRWADWLGAERTSLHGFPGAAMRREHLWAAPEPLPPIQGLTVTAEVWKPVVPDRSRTPTRRIAVVDVGGPSPTSAAVHDAVARHPGATPATVSDADLVIAVAPAAARDGVADAIAGLADGIDSGFLDYACGFGPRCRDVWLLTTDAEQVSPGDPVPGLAHAALAAMHRSLGFEHPDQNFHHLDLAADATPDEVTAALEVIVSGAGEYAVRAGGFYERTLGDEPAFASPWQLASGVLDNVVITGGSGAIGRSYARFLAARGAKRIVLLSRRAGEPLHLDGSGTEILSIACDLTDDAQLAEAAAVHGGDGATLVVHAAGTATFADRENITGLHLKDMAAAKISGLESLIRVWPLRDTTPILLCSSVTGVWGGKGVAAYAAANRMLDVMAARLRAEGRTCTAIRWGLWEGSGIVDAAEIARVERTGLRQMNAALAVEASLRTFAYDPLILAADPDRIRVFFGNQKPVAAAAQQDSDEPMDAPAAVRSQLAVVLDVDAHELDLDSSLFDLGVDSLLALDLRKRLKRVTGRTVGLARLLGGITGTDLIAELSEKVESPSD